MKRLVYLIIIVCVVASSVPSFSMDFLVGARGGYFLWEPWIKDFNMAFNEMETGRGALYGPVASVILTQDVSLSVSGLFGTQSGGGFSKGKPEGGEINNGEFNFDIIRADLDSALSLRLSESVKLFAGYKYWNLKTDFRFMQHDYDAGTGVLQSTNFESGTITQIFHGPAAGLGLSLPLGNRGFFVAANVSFIYMWGIFKGTSKNSEKSCIKG